MEGKRLRSGKICGAKSAANESAAPPGASALAILPHELFTRILDLVLKGDATSRASCKLVCREWRDHLRSAATRLVIGGAGKCAQLGKALQNYPHILNLEVQLGNDHPKNRVSTGKYDVLSRRAWSAVTLFTDFALQQGPASIVAFLAASHESLTSLTLGNVSLGVADFAQALMGSTGLQKLVLRRECLTAPAFLGLLESSTSMTGLKELHLDGLLYDTDEGLREVLTNHSVPMLPSTFPNLEILRVHTYLFSGFSDEAYVSLLSGLLVLTSFRVELSDFRDLDNIPVIAAQHSLLLRELSLGARGESLGLKKLGSPTFASGVLAVLEQCSSLITLRLPRKAIIPETGWAMLLEKMGKIEVLEYYLNNCDALLLRTLLALRSLILTSPRKDLGSVARVVKHLPHFSSTASQALFSIHNWLAPCKPSFLALP